MELEASPRLNAAERRLIQDLRASYIVVPCDVVHDLERRTTYKPVQCRRNDVVHVGLTSEVEIYMVMGTLTNGREDVRPVVWLVRRLNFGR